MKIFYVEIFEFSTVIKITPFYCMLVNQYQYPFSFKFNSRGHCHKLKMRKCMKINKKPNGPAS